MISVNALVQEAAEFCSMTGDGEAVDGTTAASYLNLLNRAVAKLNNDSYFSTTQDMVDSSCAAHLIFKKLVPGETAPDGMYVVDMEPPEAIVGVSRKVGIRYLELDPSTPQAMSATNSMTLPCFYTYGTTFETDPNGETRLVGDLWLNGTAVCDIRVFLNRRLPQFKLTDSIPLSPIYHDAILYTLAFMACRKYKLADYKEDAREEMNSALAIIDRNTLNNRALENSTAFADSYDRPFYDGMAGNGLAIG